MTQVADELRAMLVCPRCRGPLTDASESLHCHSCHLRYRIDEGIPMLLLNEATSDRAER